MQISEKSTSAVASEDDSGITVLTLILDDIDGPMTRSQIMAHPAWVGRSDRVLTAALRDALGAGRVQQVSHGVFDRADRCG